MFTVKFHTSEGDIGDIETLEEAMEIADEESKQTVMAAHLLIYLQERELSGQHTKDYRHFKADKDENRQIAANGTIEYIHYLIKE